MNKPTIPYLIGKFVDEDIYTLHILSGKDCCLLAEFTYAQIPALIEQIRTQYPDIASTLTRYLGDSHGRI